MLQSKRFQVICDISGANQNIVSSDKLREFLEKLVKLLNMSILQGPIIAEGIPENPGLSALVIIDFSHISIHTFSKYNEALIDIFSCKEFDKEKVLDYCLEFFEAKKENSRIKEVYWG